MHTPLQHLRMIGTPPLLGTGHPFFYSIPSSKIDLTE